MSLIDQESVRMIARHSVTLHNTIGRRIDRYDLVFRLHRDDDAMRGRIVMRIARLATQRYHGNPCICPRVDHEISAPALVRNKNFLLGWRISDPIRKPRTRYARDDSEGAIVDDSDFMASGHGDVNLVLFWNGEHSRRSGKPVFARNEFLRARIEHVETVAVHVRH